MDQLDAMFAEINNFKLTAPVPTAITGKNLRGVNELPLISQAVGNAVATVAWSLSSPSGQKNIQKTIERSVNRKFFPYINSMAAGNSKSLHHLYEWGNVGSTSARLFDLVIPAGSRGRANFSMKVNFRPSKKMVPLTEAQATPNKSTGAVVKKKHIFYNKALVMEYGMSVVVRPLGKSKLAFDKASYDPGLNMNPLSFTSKPINIDYSERPTYKGLEMVLESFFAGSGRRDISESVDRYAKSVKRGAEKSALMISVSRPSDAHARAVADKISESLVVA